MPRVITHGGGGWGCTCPAFRNTVPADRLLNTLAAAAGVTVRLDYVVTRPYPDDGAAYYWEAWTRPEDVYKVSFEPDKPSGGWCKHCAACAADLVGGQLNESYRLIGEVQTQCRLLEREVKKLDGKVLKLTQRSTETQS